MIANDAIVALIRKTMPDAEVAIVDRTGTMDHYNITVRSSAFAGKNLIEQHQMVYRTLKAAHDDGRIHAIELKTIVAEK
jgi:stress-induced morphogen